VKFYLGIHQPKWLSEAGVPCFVSLTTIGFRKRLETLPEAKASWSLDSGGYTELSRNGKWVITPEQYVEQVRILRDHVGNMDWAATQDWICAPNIVKETKLSVEAHQKKTIRSYLELKELAPEILWCPMIQGWTEHEYMNCVDMYYQAGVDLHTLPIVGVGSVAGRQRSPVAERIVRRISKHKINVHAFGFKQTGLRNSWDCLTSADSMAWSFRARMSKPLPGCTHKTCSNCLKFALRWREEMLGKIDRPHQFPLLL
jgi:hypothetical protein